MEQKATDKPAGMAENINGNANGGKSRQNYKKNKGGETKGVHL